MATITINRALSLIKKMEASLNEQIREGIFVSLIYKTGYRPYDTSFKTVEEVVKRIQSDTDKVHSALTLIPKIKEAIAKKNLETKVTLKGKEYSVTEVLAMKTQVASRNLLIRTINNQIEDANRKIQNSVEPQSQKDLSAEEYKAFLSLHELAMVTGNNSSPSAFLQELKEENEILRNEIDFILSEINIRTTIEVEGL